MLYKGVQINKEEYSIMQNPDAAGVLVRLIAALGITHIDICGLAGNVCVLNTAKDMLGVVGASSLRILTPYAPSLDDGSALKAFVKENGIAS